MSGGRREILTKFCDWNHNSVAVLLLEELHLAAERLWSSLAGLPGSTGR